MRRDLPTQDRLDVLALRAWMGNARAVTLRRTGGDPTVSAPFPDLRADIWCRGSGPDSVCCLTRGDSFLCCVFVMRLEVETLVETLHSREKAGPNWRDRASALPLVVVHEGSTPLRGVGHQRTQVRLRCFQSLFHHILALRCWAVEKKESNNDMRSRARRTARQLTADGHCNCEGRPSESSHRTEVTSLFATLAQRHKLIIAQQPTAPQSLAE